MAQAQMHPDAVFVLEFIGSPQRGFIAELRLEEPGRDPVKYGTLADCSPLHSGGEHARWILGSLAAFHRKAYKVITRGWPSYMDTRRDKIDSRSNTPGSIENFPAPGSRVPLKSDPVKQERGPMGGESQKHAPDTRGPLTGERDWF